MSPPILNVPEAVAVTVMTALLYPVFKR
jgi:hypothetical protein